MIPSSGCPPWPPDHPRTLPRTGTPTPPRGARPPEGLRTGRAPGAPPRLTDAHRAALVARVDAGPIPAIHGVVRWRLIDLIQWLWEEFRLSISKQTLSRDLRAMN